MPPRRGKCLVADKRRAACSGHRSQVETRTDRSTRALVLALAQLVAGAALEGAPVMALGAVLHGVLGQVLRMVVVTIGARGRIRLVLLAGRALVRVHNGALVVGQRGGVGRQCRHLGQLAMTGAQEFGLAGDVCPMPEAELGVSIDDDAPILGACAVQCNTTCDGSLMSNGGIAKRLELEDGIPIFQLAAPLRHREDDVQDYAAQEIRNCIAFIEEKTGEKWDWKYYFECAKRVNESTRHRMEWLDMNKTDYPQIFGSNLALYTETNYMAICGKVPEFVDVDRKLTALANQAYKDKMMMAKEYRHRAIVWGVQSHFYMDFLLWILNCWGIVPLTDMLSMVNTEMIAEEDTPQNREKAYYDMAWLTENMIMRNRTHGGYKVLLDELWEYCEEFNADMVILWEHMACKALNGMHGQFEEKAREKGIHLIWVTHDLFDPRIVSRQGVRDQVNRYMRTVFKEEPLDPSLEILHDEHSW